MKYIYGFKNIRLSFSNTFIFEENLNLNLVSMIQLVVSHFRLIGGRKQIV